MNLENLMTQALQTASVCFTEHGGNEPILPVLMFENEAGAVGVVGMPICDKETAAAAMRFVLRESRAVRYALVTESWMLDPNAVRSMSEAQLARAMDGGLAATPGRIEALTVAGQDKATGEQGLAWRQILRPEHGKPCLGVAVTKIDKGVDGKGTFRVHAVTPSGRGNPAAPVSLE